jgi:hypothetical protein
LIGAENGYNYMSGNTDGFDIIYMGRGYGTYENVETGKVMWRCVDIKTGEQYWEKEPATTTASSFFGTYTVGLVPNCVTNYGNDLVLVSGDRLYKWDPETGEMTLNVTALSASPSGVGFFGGGGSPLTPDPFVLSVQNLGGGTYALVNWTIEGSTSNFTSNTEQHKLANEQSRNR